MRHTLLCLAVGGLLLAGGCASTATDTLNNVLTGVNTAQVAVVPLVENLTNTTLIDDDLKVEWVIHYGEFQSGITGMAHVIETQIERNKAETPAGE